MQFLKLKVAALAAFGLVVSVSTAYAAPTHSVAWTGVAGFADQWNITIEGPSSLQWLGPNSPQNGTGSFAFVIDLEPSVCLTPTCTFTGFGQQIFYIGDTNSANFQDVLAITCNDVLVTTEAAGTGTVSSAGCFVVAGSLQPFWPLVVDTSGTFVSDRPLVLSASGFDYSNLQADGATFGPLQSVPEPTTWALSAIGIGAFLVRNARRRRAGA